MEDPREAASRLAGAGARVLAEPAETPWRSPNARLEGAAGRLEGAAGLQLTLFEELGPA